jgi:hypothetical protein
MDTSFLKTAMACTLRENEWADFLFEKNAFLGAAAGWVGKKALGAGTFAVKNPGKTLGLLTGPGMSAAFNTMDVANKSVSTARSIANSNNRLKGAVDAAQVFS